MNNYLKLTFSFFTLIAITFSANTISQEVEEVVDGPRGYPGSFRQGAHAVCAMFAKRPPAHGTGRHGRAMHGNLRVLRQAVRAARAC